MQLTAPLSLFPLPPFCPTAYLSLSCPLNAPNNILLMRPAVWFITAAFFGFAHAALWPNSSNYVVALQKAWNGKHWTADVQIKTSSAGVATVPLIIDSSISHMIVMSQSLCDLRVCEGCGYTPPITGTCLPVNPTPNAIAEDNLLVDMTTVALYVASGSAPIAFLNQSFPLSPSNFHLAVPSSSGNDPAKIIRGAQFWNGTAGR